MGKILFILIIGLIQVCFQSEKFLVNDTRSAPVKYFKTVNFARVNPKKLGGKPARLAKAKFMVSIRKKFADYPFGEGHYCGGILISLTRALTSAYCFFELDEDDDVVVIPDDEIRIVLGSVNRFKRDESTLVFDEITYAYHRFFTPGERQNDIGMLSFKGIIDAKNPVVQPISLTVEAKEAGENCKVMGWGNVIDTRTKFFSDVLLVADINILNLTVCKSQFDGIQDNGMICAGSWSGAYDACLDDSGGPLICDNYLTGIVSSGINCGTPMLPRVYTDIMTYRSWIDLAKEINLKCKTYAIGKNVFIQIFVISFIYILC